MTIDKDIETIYKSIKILIPQMEDLLNAIDELRESDDAIVSTVKIEDMISIEDKEVNRGIYVWGGNGQDLSEMKDPEQWIRDKETSPENAERSIALYHKRKAEGVKPIRAFDCSGLQFFAGKQIGVFKSDVSSRGIFASCHEIAKEDLRRGDFAFRHDGTKIVHVALYIGNGKVIEAIGRDEGVVISPLRSNFNRFGRLEALWK